jgi:HAD superfamily hydrolase (TIGR01509 family)
VREARAILFDLDGVLVDSYAVWFHLLAALAEELGYPPIGAEAFRAGWGQGIEADVRDFFPRHGTAALERLYAERLGRHLEHLVVPAEVPAVFAALRARRMGSAVVTNSPAGMARLLLERAGATPDVLVGGTDVPRPKPAPDSVLHACRRLGVEPGAAWLVGDTAFDREAARAAGVRFAGLGLEGDLRLSRLGDLLALIGAPGS